MIARTRQSHLPVTHHRPFTQRHLRHAARPPSQKTSQDLVDNILAANLRLTQLRDTTTTHLVRVLALPHILENLRPHWPSAQYDCFDLVRNYYTPTPEKAAALSGLLQISHGMHGNRSFDSLQMEALGRQVVGRPEHQLGVELSTALMRLGFGGYEAKGAPRWKDIVLEADYASLGGKTSGGHYFSDALGVRDLLAEIRGIQLNDVRHHGTLEGGPVSERARLDTIQRLGLLIRAARIWIQALERIT